VRSLAVFCGSHAGHDPRHSAAAAELGQTLARRGTRVVYGGGSVGLMGVVADAALAAGGEVVGVIPRFLFEREVGHRGLTELRVVESMHERKATIAELSDGFVALPGGVGTLEEICEIWTWVLLGLHRKPCGLLNVARYFDGLVAFLDGAVAAGFVAPAQRALLQVATDVPALLASLAAAPLPPPPKWTPGAPAPGDDGVARRG
jgi:hypothetical protein